MSKRRKPKKPPSKKTEHLLLQLSRKSGTRSLADRFLIVCEDDKSAPNYFRALRRYLNLTATSIQVAGSGGKTQPIQVVDFASATSDDAKNAKDGGEPFKHVWAVIDGDYGSAINNARKSAKANKVNLAVSTPCFEHWVLLHFEDATKPMADCAAAVRALRKHLPDYTKGKTDFSEVVKNHDEACKRAAKSRKAHLSSFPNPEDQNPCSEIYRLIEKLRSTKSTSAP